ncbi:hypothetical protein K435DRAFT_810043 [Dendrothele bispora CBS 962.96]|uniref:Uncharacterized protein n=1 Tax=Dendrothele bispora (strain CBS 962.96) TaxID=1314807 RepID=A0A4S8KWC1_DENBC|nr:hypothetical protein K435DRAFT_810043 [Dendrothele bispora CBS 962.96]
MSKPSFFDGAFDNTFSGPVNNVTGDQTNHHGPSGPTHNETRTFNGSISSYKEHDNSTVHGRSIENYGSYQEDNGVARRDNLVTPEQLRDAFDNYFEAAVIEYAGYSQPWQDPSTRDVQNLWKKVMPNEFHDQFSSFSTTIEGWVNETLTNWRDSFGNAVLEALESIFTEQDLDDINKRKTYIAEQRAGSRLQNRPYYFTGTRNGTPTGAFQSYIVARTLSEHFKTIQRIPDNKRSSSPPSGALILTIFAIERTLDHYSSSNENVYPLGDLSKDSQALPVMRRIQAFTTGRNSKNQDWISYEVWSKIKAAAQSHIEPPTIPVQEGTGDEDEALMDCEPFQ